MPTQRTEATPSTRPFPTAFSRGRNDAPHGGCFTPMTFASINSCAGKACLINRASSRRHLPHLTFAFPAFAVRQVNVHELDRARVSLFPARVFEDGVAS